MITEALLEAHYLKALQAAFKDFFGGPCQLIKPSQQQEAWLGFDQGYAVSSFTTTELQQWLAGMVQNPGPQPPVFMGFFLQFKVVHELAKSSKHTPAAWPVPHYRSELSLRPNKTTGLSQHESLVKLDGIGGARAYYACPMLFSSDEVWNDPDLAAVPFVPLAGAPAGWLSTEPHFLYFRTKQDLSPIWKSEPVQGKAIGFQAWLEERRKHSLRAVGALAWLKEVDSAASGLSKTDYRGVVESQRLAIVWPRGEPQPLPGKVIREASIEYVEVEPEPDIEDDPTER